MKFHNDEFHILIIFILYIQLTMSILFVRRHTFI